MPNQLIYLLTCNRGIKDEASKLFSFVDILDTIWIPKEVDFIWWSLCVGGRCYVDTPGEIKIEITFLYPDNTLFSPPSIIAGNLLSAGDVHFTAVFPVTRFTQVGKHILKISLNGQELKSANEFYFNVTKLA